MQGASRRNARRSAMRSAGAVGLMVASYAALPLRGERWWLGALAGAGVLVAVVPLTANRLRAVLRSDRPVLEAAEALVLLVAMLLLGFAAVYFGMNRHDDQFAGLDTRVDAVYFTVTTLSTVGFGDIAATGQAARAVVTTQILFNLVFLGVAVRALVGTARRVGWGPTDR